MLATRGVLSCSAAFALLGYTSLFGAQDFNECQISKEQKIKYARLLMNSDLYQSEIGGWDNPWEYSGYEDEDLSRLLSAAQRDIRSARSEHYRATQSLKNYQNQLVASGKVTRAGLSRYVDPSGQLENLRSQVHRKYDVLGRLIGRESSLYREVSLRKDPDPYLKAEKGLQAALKTSMEYSKAITEKMKKDPDVGKVVSEGGMRPSIQRAMEERGARKRTVKVVELGKPGSPAQQSYGNNPELVSQPPCSSHTIVTLDDLHPSGAVGVQDIEAFEAREMQRLPSEIRRCSRGVQRLFMYGDYENLPRDLKRMVRHVAKTNPDKVEEIYRDVQYLKPPPVLGEQLVQQQPAKYWASAAWATGYVAQWLTNEYHREKRKEKFENAIKEVAGEIPSGATDDVLIIEEVKKHQSDVWVWFETVSIKAYPGKVPLDRQEQILDNLRKARAANYWHFRRLFTAEVVGTGRGKGGRPSVLEAFYDGLDMGRLARGAILTKELMRNAYHQYNENEKTREVFKRGYAMAAQSSSETELEAEVEKLKDEIDEVQDSEGWEESDSGEEHVFLPSSLEIDPASAELTVGANSTVELTARVFDREGNEFTDDMLDEVRFEWSIPESTLAFITGTGRNVTVDVLDNAKDTLQNNPEKVLQVTAFCTTQTASNTSVVTIGIAERELEGDWVVTSMESQPVIGFTYDETDGTYTAALIQGSIRHFSGVMWSRIRRRSENGTLFDADETRSDGQGGIRKYRIELALRAPNIIIYRGPSGTSTLRRIRK